ncbi:hypothetical protein BC941DRAFT_238473 [Chlamydoabsidia padenii]|nr:hypothetical protein BC941DRAFT_238473 [Chlamydoabsidia padenii]
MTTPATETKDSLMESRPDLYSLIGGTPPIAFVKPTYQANWATKKKAESWTNKPFLHPARTDTLVLHHWVKQSDQDDDYHFAKFNRVIDIIDYTDEDYEAHLTDNDWTKDETDYLFRLCRLYDLRFPVIADRYDFTNGTTRTMEDMKDRYYAVNRKLIKARGGHHHHHHYNSPVEARHATLEQYNYDKVKETERKQALIGLYQRTREQIQEEEILFLEAKRMEENKEQLTTQRDQLYSTLHLEQAQQVLSTPLTPLASSSSASSYMASAPLSASSTSSSSSHLASSSSHGPTSASSVANPGGIGITGGTSGAAHDQKKKKKEEIVKKARRISTSSPTVEEMLPPPPEKKEKLIPGPYVRSQKLPAVKTTMQPSVLQFLAELGIGARPVMPTEEICYKYDHLQNSVVALLELKKVAEKLDINTKVKGRKHSLSVSSSSTNRSANDRRRKLG